MRPVPRQFKITFNYGELYPPGLQYLTVDKKHHGVDYGVPIGIPVGVCVDGVLNHKGFLRGYGLAVIIKFWTGLLFWKKEYRLILAHLSEITTIKNVGGKINKYENVGLSGNSGVSTGPHLHAEVQTLTKNGWFAVDPKFILGSS